MLSPGDAQRIADAVAERLAPSVPELLTVAQLAERLGVDETWIRRHAAELGAVRLGDGPKPRVRFEPEAVAEYLAARRERTAPPDSPASTVRLERRRQARAASPERRAA